MKTRTTQAGEATAADLLQAIFADAEGFIEFRTFKNEKSGPRHFTPLPLNGDLPDLPADHDVFFGVAPRVRHGGKATDIRTLTALWADVDGKAFKRGKSGAWEAIQNLGDPLAPSAIVDSGHGFHCYWFLHKPMNPALGRAVMDALREAIALGLDHVSDAPRILRLPGTLNHKGPGQRPAPVMILSLSPERRFNERTFSEYLDWTLDQAKPSLPPADLPDNIPSLPQDKLAAMIANDDVFAKSWNRDRPDLQDQSPSAYECSLATRAVLAGCWTNDEIAALLVTWGRKHRGPDEHPEKVFRKDYLERTIVCARKDAAKESDDDDGDGKSTQAEMLMRFLADADLFHTSDDRAFALVGQGKRRQLLRIDARGGTFRPWLIKRFAKHTGKPPSTNALASVTELAAARARLDGPLRPVHLRVASHGGNIYLDIARPESAAAVKIAGDGWTIVPAPPLLFERTEPTAELATPAEDASAKDLGLLGDLFALSPDDTFMLAAWILCALRPDFPFPILHILGEPGSGKSTLTRFVRSVIDPAGEDGRLVSGRPKDGKDIFAAVKASHVLSIDNVSHVPEWLSDLLSSLATGSGQVTRRLYSDSDVALVEGKRPIILNGVSVTGMGGDLLDRCFTLQLSRPKNRVAEAAWWERAEQAKPRILAGLLDAASVALRNLPEVHLRPEQTPRMADVAEWVVAAEPALQKVPQFKTLTFLDVYARNREAMATDVLQGDRVAQLVRRLVAAEPFVGTAGALLEDIVVILEDEKGIEKAGQIQKRKSWPSNARAMGARLRKISPQLRDIGIECDFTRQRVIEIRKVPAAAGADEPQEETETPY